MSRTVFWEHCPLTFKPIPCTATRYRTYTAHCNNLKHPNWGATNTPYVRYLPPVYSDGIQGPRESVIKGAELPNVRLVTSIVHNDHDHPGGELTILIMSWGQFIDHDLALAAPPRGKSPVTHHFRYLCGHYLIDFFRKFFEISSKVIYNLLIYDIWVLKANHWDLNPTFISLLSDLYHKKCEFVIHF